MIVDMKLDGAKDVFKALSQLPGKVEKQVLRKACREALKPMLAAAKAEAPKDTGLLQSSLVIRAAKKKKRGAIAFEIRPNENKFTDTSKGYYPAQVEYGTSDTIPNPFLSRAFDSTKNSTKDAAVRAIASGILRLANKG